MDEILDLKPMSSSQTSDLPLKYNTLSTTTPQSSAPKPELEKNVEIDLQTPQLNEQPQISTWMILKGTTIWTIFIILFAVYSLLIKVAMQSYSVSVPEILYHSSLLALPMFYIVLRGYDKQVFDLNPKDFKNMLLRCFFGTACDQLVFLAYVYISYAKGFCLYFTNTLMSPFLARYILGEPLQIADFVGIMFGFTGMLLLVQPWKNKDNDTVFFNELIGAFFGLLSAVGASLSLIWSKKLSQTIHFSQPPFYFYIIQLIVACVWCLQLPNPQTEYTFGFYIMIFIIAFTHALVMLTMTLSMNYNSIGMMQVICYLAIPIGYLLDWMVFKTQIGLLEFIGAGIIFGVNIVITVLRIKKIIN